MRLESMRTWLKVLAANSGSTARSGKGLTFLNDRVIAERLWTVSEKIVADRERV
jgi:hypothetical protein